jgi:hypothetical protein
VKPAPATPRRARGDVTVDRRDVDDQQAHAELVRLLADLLFPSAPDDPARR